MSGSPRGGEQRHTLSAPFRWLHDRYCDEITERRSEEAIVKQLHKLFLREATTLLAESCQRQPPLNPLVAFPLRKIYECEWVDHLSGDREAELLPVDNGFVLRIRRSQGSLHSGLAAEVDTRVRTTMAHEIGHTFFFDIEAHPPRHALGLGYDLATGVDSHPDKQREEWWCFDFAREFLLPTHLLRYEVSRIPTLDEALKLKKRYRVSWNLLFRKLIHDMAQWRNCAAFLGRLASDKTMAVTRVWKSREFGKLNVSEYLREIDLKHPSEHESYFCDRKRIDKGYVVEYCPSSLRGNGIVGILTRPTSVSITEFCTLSTTSSAK